MSTFKWDSVLGNFDVELGEFGASRIAMHDGVVRPDLDKKLGDDFDAHLKGEAVSLRLDLHGLSPLRQITLAKLLEIPFGEVRSYSWVAREIGRPAAIRAVASAVAKNPLPLIIPCHRVVRSDGVLGEYSLGGAEEKKRVLKFEGLDIKRVEDLAARSIRFLGDEKEKVFHVSTCRLAPIAGSDEYLELRSAKAAEELLMKPCIRCRPIFMF